MVHMMHIYKCILYNTAMYFAAGSRLFLDESEAPQKWRYSQYCLQITVIQNLRIRQMMLINPAAIFDHKKCAFNYTSP